MNFIETAIQALPVAYLVGTAVPLMVVDIREHRLPNKLVLPAFPITLLSWLALAVAHGDWVRLLIALACAVVMFAFGLVVNRFGILGMGDAKLWSSQLFVLGWFGWQFALLAPALAIVLAIAHIGWRYLRQGSRIFGASIAFGPHLIIAFVFLAGVALLA